jgi:protein-S-isoprenylcysteine O-methyltransferase Ste14
MAAMICGNCGTEIADKALICYRCGTPTAAPRITPPQSRARRPGLAILVALLLLLGVALLVAQRVHDDIPRLAAYAVAAAALLALVWRFVVRR